MSGTSSTQPGPTDAATPAADAAEVVAYIVHEPVDVGVGTDRQALLCWDIRECDDRYEALVTEADHLSAIAALQAQIAELEARQVPDGWVAVPLEPTQTMCQEGQWKAKEWPTFPLRISPIYKAMIAAAPSNPTTQSPEGR